MHRGLPANASYNEMASVMACFIVYLLLPRGKHLLFLASAIGPSRFARTRGAAFYLPFYPFCRRRSVAPYRWNHRATSCR